MKALLLILLVLLSSLAEARRSKNYAILINTSKFWFNYRQTTNSLLIYNFLKENGIPDENVQLITNLTSR
jgi:GPI-anchor transamidase subunit K